MRIFCTLAVLALAVSSHAAELFDVSKLDRAIAKEPAYVAKQPLYGLAAIGKTAQLRIWMVLDKSKADGDAYDVVYVDLNGNGDLTDPGEKVTSEKGRFGRGSFALPELADANGGEAHTEFKLTVSSSTPPTHMISLMWHGKHKIGGGYPQDPDDGYLSFAPSPEKAPIVWINGDGPFRFQRWYSGELTVGGADDFKVFLGLPGDGANSFCAFQRHVLPDDEPVLATLIYTDKDGNEQSVESELKERC